MDPRVILFNWSYPFTLLRIAEEKGDMQSSDIHSTIAVNVSLGKSSVKVCQWCQCRQLGQSGVPELFKDWTKNMWGTLILGGNADKISANFLSLRNLFKEKTHHFGKDYTYKSSRLQICQLALKKCFTNNT